MASVGPREIDLGWMIYIHRFFQDLVEDLELPGMPDILRRETVAAALPKTRRATNPKTSTSTPPMPPSGMAS